MPFSASAGLLQLAWCCRQRTRARNHLSVRHARTGRQHAGARRAAPPARTCNRARRADDTCSRNDGPSSAWVRLFWPEGTDSPRAVNAGPALGTSWAGPRVSRSVIHLEPRGRANTHRSVRALVGRFVAARRPVSGRSACPGQGCPRARSRGAGGQVGASRCGEAAEGLFDEVEAYLPTVGTPGPAGPG